MSTEAGKGSSRRPGNQDSYAEAWVRIFEHNLEKQKAKRKEEKPEELVKPKES
jgi:hypothetical protein